MFNSKLKERIEEVNDHINNYIHGREVKATISGTGQVSYRSGGLKERVEGLQMSVNILEQQNDKLRALLNEVIDHVYGGEK